MAAYSLEWTPLTCVMNTFADSIVACREVAQTWRPYLSPERSDGTEMRC